MADNSDLAKILYDFGQGKYGDQKDVGLKVALKKILLLIQREKVKARIDELNWIRTDYNHRVAETYYGKKWQTITERIKALQSEGK